ncbi:hypothetical protein [Stenomitos frigidus]|uniref:hypothetical protein n=1 Tax=Stenomitos frigidus TaxID=1886765 RepID=UPI0015E64792|nr:hypothetical protein [Stenomitos frigidus]
MRDSSDRRPLSRAAEASYTKKRLGGYLVEAGLLTTAQIDVALNDQKLTGMRFGEILAARGWVKQQTIEYLMHKVVMPEQQAVKQPNGRAIDNQHPEATSAANARVSVSASPAEPEPSKQLMRRELPIAKPLPSSGKPDGDISWVG